ncbi:hypothetical protein GQR58_006866 [Nymphon striatum]|nr:hypothetical protein GQR58_006866 [Nymphon striatum]
MIQQLLLVKKLQSSVVVLLVWHELKMYLTETQVLGHFVERMNALEEQQVVDEAERCMSCGMCFECDNCVIYCPQDAVFRVKKDQSTTGRYVDTDYNKCIGCHICSDVCPTGYIEMGLGVLVTSEPPALMKASKQFDSDEIRDKHVAHMRKNHMDELMHKRDETVYNGIRTKKYSLNACIDCHVPEQHNGEVLRHTNPEHFCSTCHGYVAAKLDCFDCHVDHPVKQEATAKNEPKSSEEDSFSLAHSAVKNHQPEDEVIKKGEISE